MAVLLERMVGILGNEKPKHLPIADQLLRESILLGYLGIVDRINHIKSEPLRNAIELYLSEHALLVDYFTWVPESLYNIRINGYTPQGPSASTRDQLIHIIENTTQRLGGFETGEYTYKSTQLPLRLLDKSDLLAILVYTNDRLVELALGNARQTITTPRGIMTPADFVVDMIPHQYYHQGLHLAGPIDYLGLPWPPTYARWGLVVKPSS
ncbi:MAG: hypothetical protein UV61_C0001G0055 [Candidatus Gottesmanbacteria bacterium GW2011_GWB1_43_11]|uniref:Uncharacterized protein n=1 Tax=Candidatus Gottesmanbacteria bacterium GW2011_GWB1_43_11 TaxID=1618446 RepID=A0A0G1FL74_9BACT|nr:MAG: hypothetical protein UV04_C0011G0005 [Candidatus Gottesmanbacteria bacterium GW2011_GWA2_42_16]KKS55605.1 MAG: hypothetical protein UV17_C0010G0023 [Candidatus Gottesmanbacteria bacterium GW2011_GWA1_42_26]KKS81572.1 MAG: hypothetical protein UV55_C0012G0056 [Candidatus Gottesmanbacteria bacterium GW2011_GWC1_43_10]KKS87648.1 MAG: hypothetical protein UV61_C0001G0055 [Candidatus Gottesmanbacteria bacterium GW2011_GWB1_43_11]OGG08847.1 MAG: hypothetical protein A2699_06000 [Candidatus Go